MMVKQLKLSHTFRSIKLHCNHNPNSEIKSTEISSPSRNQEWCVYLIASTNPPFKTYVGVTTDFSRRLKQHNGELRGGAKASRAGRPWLCACLVQGFSTHSLACQFESKWKNTSRKMPRKRTVEEEKDKVQHLLVRHRYAAMEKLKDSFDFDNLQVDWQFSPF
ncbi:structure-specific endonuclease subunit SLX1 [Silene latifolia]|uniref:structure-specific endonuclease subunit SLX1 n=1 Tax=Silene latifolia TaxID=37657 RepID=UPI003D7741E8